MYESPAAAAQPAGAAPRRGHLWAPGRLYHPHCNLKASAAKVSEAGRTLSVLSSVHPGCPAHGNSADFNPQWKEPRKWGSVVYTEFIQLGNTMERCCVQAAFCESGSSYVS